MNEPRTGRSQLHRAFNIGLLLCTAGTLAACAHQPSPYGQDVPGFFVGLWHGFTIIFSLIGSIFMDIRIYEFPNSGGGYDFGYVIGAAMFLGGTAGGAASSS